MKLILVSVKPAIGAAIVPLPCWLRATVGVAVPFAVKLLPVIVISVPTGPDAGLNEVIAGGGAFENVTLSLADELLPATSVACAVIVLEPGVSVIEQLNDPFCTVAAPPSQVTAEIPDNASDTLPVAEIEDEVNVAPFAGELILIAGGVLSKLTDTVVEAVFPAISVAVPEIT